MRIIMAASTASEVLISMRFIISAFEASMSCEERIAQIMNTAVPISRETSPLSSTKPVSARVILVCSRPSVTTARLSAISTTKSPVLRQSLRYTIRSGMPSFLSGSGR